MEVEYEMVQQTFLVCRLIVTMFDAKSKYFSPRPGRVIRI